MGVGDLFCSVAVFYDAPCPNLSQLFTSRIEMKCLDLLDCLSKLQRTGLCRLADYLELTQSNLQLAFLL